MHRLAQEIVHLRDAFHAGKTAASHDEGQQRASYFGVGFDLRLFERVDEVVAQVERIAEILEWAGMLAHAGNLVVVELRAERDDQVIIRKDRFDRLRAGAEGHGMCRQVDRLHFARVKPGRAGQPADRTDDVVELDRPGNHLRQHRLEDEIIVPAHDDDLDRLALLRRHQFFQVDRGVNAAKPTAQDQNSLLHRCERPNPAFCSRQIIAVFAPAGKRLTNFAGNRRSSALRRHSSPRRPRWSKGLSGRP